MRKDDSRGNKDKKYSFCLTCTDCGIFIIGFIPRFDGKKNYETMIHYTIRCVDCERKIQMVLKTKEQKIIKMTT